MKRFATLLFVGLLAAPAAGEDRFEIAVRQVEGDFLCDVRARSTSVELLVRAIAKEVGMEVEDFDLHSEPDPVSVNLVDRPLYETLHTLLGCAGLRGRFGGGKIRILRESPAFGDRMQLEQLAEIAYQRALRLFPEDARAADAELALAELYAGWGEHARARARLEYLIESQPQSPLLPEALLRLGRILQELEEWGTAAERFRELGDTQTAHEYHEEARVELARCSIELGRFRQALHMVQALDTSFPTTDPARKRDRLLLTAAAENGEGRPVEALRTLGWYESLGLDTATQFRAMRIRGRALELTGREQDAALAWLRYSQGVEGEEQAEALAEASRLALADGNELAAIFIGAHSEKLGLGGSTSWQVDQARVRLGLTPETVVGGSLEYRMERAQQLLSRGLGEAARETLVTAWAGRGALQEDVQRELAVLFARCVNAAIGIDAAVEILRVSASELAHPESRKRIYVTAGELLEQEGRMDAALAAYGGTL